jgi:hypothetical protein
MKLTKPGQLRSFAAYPQCWADHGEIAMTDVTARMNAYRECVRHLWNTQFQAEAEPGHDWDLRDGFNKVAAQLFRLLILRPLDRENWDFQPDHWSPREPFPFLRVVVDTTSEILVNRELASGYWDHPLKAVHTDELDLRFLQYFDWWDLGVRDWAYYRVRIVGSATHPAVVGKDALLPVGSNVRVLGEAAQQGDEADKA